MILTLDKLKELNACAKGTEWFRVSGCKTVEGTCEELLTEDRFNWANWLIPRLLSHLNKVKYAYFPAKEVLPIFEKDFPDDFRVRNCIAAIERYLTDPTEENLELLKTAATYAATAAYVANAAIAAATAAAYASYAAYVAIAAITTAAATAAQALPTKEFKQRIIRNGLKLLKEQEGNK